jgi:hypothetical protein
MITQFLCPHQGMNMTILDRLFDVYDRVQGSLLKPFKHSHSSNHSWFSGIIGGTLILLLLVQLFFGWLWNQEPDAFDVAHHAAQLAEQNNNKLATGYITTATLIKVAETMLNKPGGYLSNDVLPPGLFMDNIPNWEFGVLVQIRDLSRSMRNDMSRSQSQSVEDKDLIIAEPQFHFDSSSWILPSTEGEYAQGTDALYGYLQRLSGSDSSSTSTSAQFYARADNLSDWLALIEKRLGSMSQRLSASVGQQSINTELAGDADTKLTPTIDQLIEIKTPWTKIDDVFYEARGAAWALSHFLKAAEIDFQDILQKKNAMISLRQIIRELDATQATVWSPMILNGGGFGFFANHSLVMANYISRANAAVIDLRALLSRG